MIPEEQKAPIDFSDAKEPPTVLNTDKEAAPIESDEVTKDYIELNPNPDELSREGEGTENLQDGQVIKANISAG
jgi:hypothetical protein